ncbi:MAG TPA: branched chain amino acid aminotransferase, partial [Chitinophagaceae bacterium]|nr:branched chain amino acid aminotransferase [Chitinophagaceae bacterium]
MEAISTFIVRKTRNSRLAEIDFDNLGFGKYVSDHMLVSDYSHGEWDIPQLVPFSNLSLSPASLALHYGQTVFEGMKAFYMADGRINIFRIDRHYDRFVKSLERMCMAVPSRETFIESLTRLVEIDRDWVPKQPGASLYLRPFM